MSDNRVSPELQKLFRYFNDYSSATLLLRVAAHDYAAARCLLFNQMSEGLVMGAQAIEKYFKAYLILADTQHVVRKFSHSLPKLLSEASEIFPHLALQGFAPLVEKFWRHYQARYPDNPDASLNKTTADVYELDELIIFLNEKCRARTT